MGPPPPCFETPPSPRSTDGSRWSNQRSRSLRGGGASSPLPSLTPGDGTGNHDVFVSPLGGGRNSETHIQYIKSEKRKKKRGNIGRIGRKTPPPTSQGRGLVSACDASVVAPPPSPDRQRGRGGSLLGARLGSALPRRLPSPSSVISTRTKPG